MTPQTGPDDSRTGRIKPKTVSIVHVFIAAKAPERGLAKQSGHPVPSVPPGSRVHKTLFGHLGQSESIIKFPVGQKPRIGSDLGTVEFQLQPTVEIQPQNPRFTFTHHPSGEPSQTLQSANTAVILLPESPSRVAKSWFHLGNAGLIPRGADHDPTSRLTKVFGPKRALWRCGASQSVRDAVRKPW